MYNFSQEQLRRYARHFSLRECGFKGQEKILESKVLVVGAGGLGSPVAYYLAAAGVGEIGIIDADNVDLSNLQRQILHSTSWHSQSRIRSKKVASYESRCNYHAIFIYARFT